MAPGSMTVAMLKEELKKRNLPVNGLKAELQARYDEAVAKESTENVEEPKETKEEVKTPAEETEMKNEAEEKTSPDEPANTENPTEDVEKSEEATPDEAKEITEENKNDEKEKEEKEKPAEEPNVADDATVDEPKQTTTAAVNGTPANDGEQTNERKRKHESEGEGCKLYIGNLNYATQEKDLEYHFKKFGEIKDVLIPQDRDHYSGRSRSKGFGFITFKSRDDAMKAIDEMHGKVLLERTIRVEESRSKPRDRSFQRPRYNRDNYRDRNRRNDYQSRHRYGGGGGGYRRY